MAVVTLTGHLGSMGRISRLLARELSCDLLEPELAIEASRALIWPEERVRSFDAETGGLGSRAVALLRAYLERFGNAANASMFPGGAVEEVMLRTYGDTAAPGMSADDERYIGLLRGMLTFFTQRDNIVIVGRGGQAILAGTPAVHLRVVCALDERVRRISQRSGISSEQAKRRVQESDRQREAWHRKYFRIDYQAPYHYHQVVNSGLMSEEIAASLLAEAVRRLSNDSVPPAA